jgi:hypothetical protein
MAQRFHHYELAFEEYLRARRIPYVAVDEAKKALLPDGRLFCEDHAGPEPTRAALKSFDFVLYGQGSNLLVEIKGRRLGSGGGASGSGASGGGTGGVNGGGGGLASASAGWHAASAPTVSRPGTKGRGDRRRARRMENWVTQDDLDSLSRWERLFGPTFEAIFVFIYWCEEQPPDALFQEIFEHRGRWYALRAVRVRDYQRSMRTRSPRWRTMHLSPSVFEQISAPLSGPIPFSLPDPPTIGVSFFHPTRREGASLPTLDQLIPT